MDNHTEKPDQPLEALEVRVSELETRLLFQERLIEELNDALISSSGELHETRSDFARLKAQVTMLQEGGAAPATQQSEPPPPHY